MELQMLNLQTDWPFYLCPDHVMPTLVAANIEYITVIHETECPNWDQVSLNNTKLKLELKFWWVEFKKQKR